MKNKISITILLILHTIACSAQQNIFKWNDQLCEYESSYNVKKYSEIQLKNCYSLTYNYTYQITNTPSVFKPEDVKSLNPDSLDKEYNTKISQLKILDLPKTEYWNELRKSIIIELEQTYQLSQIAYQGYINPVHLKNWHYNDACLKKHADALIAGKDNLLNDWYELTTILVKENFCPEKVWEKYEEQYKSAQRLEYAKVYVTTFGWWNSAINHIERSDKKFNENTKQQQFLKLFITTDKKECDEP